MRRVADSPSSEYVCEVVPRNDRTGVWGQWAWRVLHNSNVVAEGWHKRLRKAEKAAERAAMQHKMEGVRREREARTAEVARQGKRWSPWL